MSADHHLSPEERDEDASVNSMDVITENPGIVKVTSSKKKKTDKDDFKRKESLGFRDWDEQQKAVDEFHQKEAERKAMEEQRKADELAAKEAEVFKRTQTGLDLMKKKQAEKDEQERLRKEEEAKRREEEAHAKHHKLRKDLEEAERAKRESEIREKKKAEAKRKLKLEAQAAKMKKFDEDRRWKTLPNYKKEREKELLDRVEQLKSYDPKRTKYEFFDVHRVPDAWDEDLLDAELKKAKYAKGEALLKQLEGLLPGVEKVNFFQEESEDQWDFAGLEKKLKEAKYAKGEALLKQLEGLLPGVEKVNFFQEDRKDQWDFAALEKNIAIQTDEVKAEEASGSLAFERLLLVDPQATKDGYWDASRRPRWLVTEMENTFTAKVEVIFSTVKQYKPDVTEDVYCKDGEWQVATMQKDIESCKFEVGDVKFKFMEGVMKVAGEAVNKAKYFNENDANTPWNLELMDKDLNDRFVIVIKITKEEDSTIVNKKLVVGKGWPYNRLWNELLTIANLPEVENERLTNLEIDGQANPNVNAKLGDLMKHQSVVTATLAAPTTDGCCLIL